MSAQEELEKLHSDIDATAFLANRVGDHRYSAQLREWADRIAAIREGLGKAQGEVQAYLTDEGSLLPVCFANEYRARGARLIPLYASAAPPANSAQVLVEAGTNVLTGGNHIASLLIRRMGGGDWPKDGHEVIEKYGVETYDIWCCWKSIMEFRDALAANKSEVKG